MTNLKNHLIRLGSTNPELRPHIRPVLAELDRYASVKTAKKPHFDLSNYAENYVDQVAMLANNNYGPWNSPEHAEAIVQKAIKDYAKEQYQDVIESFGKQDIKHIVEMYMYQDEADPYDLEPPDKSVGKKIEKELKSILGDSWARYSGTRADKSQYYSESNKAWQVWIEGHPTMDVDDLWKELSKALGRGFDLEVQDNVTLLVIPR